MEGLLVSANPPLTAGESAHGVFKRLDLLVAGIRQRCTHLHALFYVPHRLGLDAARAQTLAGELSQRWQMTVRVSVCLTEECGRDDSLWLRYLRPACGFFRMAAYAPTAGKRQAAALAQALAEQPGVVMIHRLRCAPPLLRQQQAPQMPVLLDLDDVEHIALQRAIAQPPFWLSKRLELLQLPALVLGERRAARRVKHVLVCSADDVAKLARIGIRNGHCIPNALAFPQVSALEPTQGLLFVGHLGYAPNQIGIEYFLDQVWPLLQKIQPQASLRIVGARPELVRHFKAPPAGVCFTGFVDDIAAEYRQARVVISPILSGSGTRLKLVEACAQARPIVSTTLGAEGLELVDGLSARFADDAASFATACAELLQDFAQCQRLAAQAHQHARLRFEHDAVADQIGRLF